MKNNMLLERYIKDSDYSNRKEIPAYYREN